MKVVVVGGGIGGLSMAIGLRRLGWQTVVAERMAAFSDKGLGFILLPNGLKALEYFGAAAPIKAQGRLLQRLVFRKPQGEVVSSSNLPPSLSIQRSVCVEALRSQLPKDVIKMDREFSRFDYDAHGKPTAVRFKNGESESADLFIAADGANSHIRKLFFPHHHTTPTIVKELVGITEAPEISRFLGDCLLKTQSESMGISLGMLPCGQSQVIWYMQYDSRRWDLTQMTPAAKREFAVCRMEGWAEPIQTLLQQCDFEKTYVWFTKDMDLLPSFHYKNVVLLGDAAHVALPFTSQGANSALDDALLLSRLFDENDEAPANFDKIFEDYYRTRKENIERYIHFGRMISDRFLTPHLFEGQKLVIPLAK